MGLSPQRSSWAISPVQQGLTGGYQAEENIQRVLLIDAVMPKNVRRDGQKISEGLAKTLMGAARLKKP